MGFKVRGSSNIDWFVLQLHYGDLPDNKDHLTGKLSLNKLSLNIDILNDEQDQKMASLYS